MSFQAYLDAVKAKTGKTPAELKVAAEEAGVYDPDMTATQLVRVAPGGVRAGARALHGRLGRASRTRAGCTRPAK